MSYQKVFKLQSTFALNFIFGQRNEGERGHSMKNETAAGRYALKLFFS